MAVATIFAEHKPAACVGPATAPVDLSAEPTCAAEVRGGAGIGVWLDAALIPVMTTVNVVVAGP